MGARLRAYTVIVAAVSCVCAAPAGALAASVPGAELFDFPSALFAGGTASDVVPIPGGTGGLLTVFNEREANLGLPVALRVRDVGADLSLGPESTVVRGRIAGTAAVVRPNGVRAVVVARSEKPRGFLELYTQTPGAATWAVARLLSASRQGSNVVLRASAVSARGDLVAAVTVGRDVYLVRVPADGRPALIARLLPGLSVDVSVSGNGDVTAAVAPLVIRTANPIRIWRTDMASTLGPPQLVATPRSSLTTRVRLAVDANDVTTLAFSSTTEKQGFLSYVRANKGQAFGAPVSLARPAEVAYVIDGLEAGAARTAMVWTEWSSSGLFVRAAASSPTGSLDRVRTPVFPGARTMVATLLGSSSLAVSPAGEAVVAYGVGPHGAVQVARLSPDATAFSKPYVVTTVRERGDPQLSLLGSGTPIVILRDRDFFLRSAATGTPPTSAMPRIRVAPLSVRSIKSGRVTVTASCSTACVASVFVLARTGKSRRSATRPGAFGELELPAGGTRSVSFLLNNAGRARLRATGRADIRAIVTVSNPSGAAVVRQQRLRLKDGRVVPTSK